jgi:DeoR/GlpR family transcriptional regulator of sugar metabolism
MIQHPAGIAVDDAAQNLDCTVRTIWRDLQVLQKLASRTAAQWSTLSC